MARSFTPGLKSSHGMLLRRSRELPVPGEILVKEGDSVSGGTIVARALLPGDLSILRLPESMGIEPFEALNGLKIKEGDVVREGDILCEHVGLFGLFRSSFASPISGVVELVTQKTGHVAVRPSPRSIEIDAYIDGRVVSITENRALVIENDCTFVQGIFGVGGERRGKLFMLPISTDKQITEEDIPQNCGGAIIVGGMRPSERALKAASERGAKGFVTGSIDDRALSSYVGKDIGVAITGDEKIPMSLIITEGFGQIPISDHVISVLRECENLDASINGATQVRAGALRPEIIIGGIRGERSKVPFDRALAVSERVRIVRVPHFGVLGVVKEIPEAIATLESGVQARVVKIEIGSNEIVTVPRANVEMA